jgi:uncharacterized protein YdhG (YjbR/CyaY superfamily)
VTSNSPIDDYLADAPEPQRSTLSQVRSILKELMPDATEEMSYGMPSFKIGGKAVAGYAHFKNHCSYFPHSGSVLPELSDQLEGFEWSKGTLKFTVDAPLSRHLLERLVDTRLDQLGLAR